ncbi:uncharacterized protein LOC143452605 isoform X1 [Clavelina lepadiformis]|uniref:uncharacterized protein LOC143452605 isoform X1 n=1 Tax=Clavelina lepadiformis TaxID=159417 RepID=UPI0040426533
MDWNTFCFDVVQGECHLIHYAFIGTPAAVWGEFCMTPSFTGLKTAEIVTIINSNGASFPFRDQVYQLVENNKGIFYYESSTSSLSYAATCNSFLIVWAHKRAYIECRRAMNRGIAFLEKNKEM